MRAMSQFGELGNLGLTNGAAFAEASQNEFSGRRRRRRYRRR